jgi:hyperosmotically inducible protein
MRMRNFFGLPAAALLLMGSVACANTARGVVEDTKENTAKVAAGAQTADVKTAIIADKEIDWKGIDVDTYADTRTVVLRGTVPSEEQKAKAEQIARRHAEGWKIDNRLTIAVKQ